MTQALTKIEPQSPAELKFDDFTIMKEQATMLVKTGFLPTAVNTPEKAIAIILTGRELGIGTMAALNSIAVIQNKPTVSPQLMLALIERSGQLADIRIDSGKEGVTCTMKRKGRSPHSETFGPKEAQAMGLANKDNYKKQAETMYRWRAVASCARVVFPDVILGLYTPDEMGADVNNDGELLSPPKNNVRAIDGNVVDAESVEEADTENEYKAIQLTCKVLNDLGDSIIWTAKELNEYAIQLFDDDSIQIETLTPEQTTFLLEDLQERVRMIEAEVAERQGGTAA